MADYATLTQVKAHLSDGITAGDTQYDAILSALITRVSRSIDKFTKRAPDAYKVESDATRYFSGSGSGTIFIDELATDPTSVAVAESGDITDYTTWASTDYILAPYNASQWGRPYTMLEIDLLYGTKATWYKYPKAVKIVGKFGYSETVPPEIEEATIIQTARLWKRGQQGFVDLSSMVELGQLQIRKLDPDVSEILLHFIRGVI
jgi:hypothetical protein